MAFLSYKKGIFLYKAIPFHFPALQVLQETGLYKMHCTWYWWDHTPPWQGALWTMFWNYALKSPQAQGFLSTCTEPALTLMDCTPLRKQQNPLGSSPYLQDSQFISTFTSPMKNKTRTKKNPTKTQTLQPFVSTTQFWNRNNSYWL